MKRFKLRPMSPIWPCRDIYGETIEEAVANNLSDVIHASYDNVWWEGKKKLLHLSYKPGILGGKGGYEAEFSFYQGCGNKWNERVGTTWIYADKDGNPTLG